MATIGDLDKKYKELFPEAAVSPVATPVATVTKPTTDLDQQYKALFEPEQAKATEIIAEKPQETKLEAYTGPSITQKKEPLWRKAVKVILPKAVEDVFGLNKPMPEKTTAELMKENESARQVYYREQHFTEKLNSQIKENPKLPVDYKEPTSFFGQLIEGVEAGWKSTVVPAVGYFSESMGIKIGSPKMIEWGQDFGDQATINYLKQPELARPADLKGVFDGGLIDSRYYGRIIGETLPYMASAIGFSIAGGLIAGPPGATVGAFASVAAVEQGNAYKQMIDSGIAVDKAADASILYGAVASIIENMFGYMPAKIATQALNPSKVLATGFKQYLLKELPKMGVAAMWKSVQEGGEEVAQQIAQDLFSKWAGSSEGMTSLKDLGEQFAAGAIGSIPFGVSEFKAPEFKTQATIQETVPTPITPQTVVPEKVAPVEVPVETPKVSTIEQVIPEVKEKIANFSEAYKKIQSLGGFANIEKMPLEQKNAYAAEQLAQSLNLNKKFLFTNATEKGIDLSEELKNFDKLRGEKGNTIALKFTNDLMDKLVAEEAPKIQIEKVAEEFKPLAVEAAKFNNAEDFIQSVRLTSMAKRPKNAAEAKSIKAELAKIPVNKLVAVTTDLLTQWDIEANGNFTEVGGKKYPTRGWFDIARDFYKEVKPTQKEIVKEAVKEKPKTIKEIAEETKILEPNVRRILGTGTKEGTFERVDKGVYVLRKDGKDIAYIHTGDAIAILPKLAAEGFKADMVFLDIPYRTPAVVGGNRGIKYDYITPEQFKTVVNAVKNIVRSEDSAVFYMYSQARSGLKEMQRYNDVITNAGFIPLAKGNYTKLQKDGLTRVRNMRGDIIEPEGLMMMNLSGNNIAKVPVNLEFTLIRPKGYQTEKPAAMLKALIEVSTKEGETVLDPFAGSGVTVAEAVRAGRKAVAIEKSEKAVEEHIKPKIEAATKEITKTFYRGGGEGAVPEAKTAQDILNYEIKELGNADVVAEPGIDLKKIPAKNVQWLTETRKAAAEYGKVQEVKIANYRIVARDDEGGVLVETLPEKKAPVLKGAAGAAVGKFRTGENVELGKMDEVHPIEFPELVELAKELSGAVPAISKRLRTSLGKFYATEKGRIALNPEIFRKGNEGQLASTLAHEIGHLVDYLPDYTIKRGNLLGSLLTLRSFLKNQYGEVEIKNTDIREELVKASEYWRPYDAGTASQSYINYRNSARELYADAISLLFNTPGTLERLAPKFYAGFFEYLDSKPEVKNAYFDLQEIISHDRATLIELRRTRTREMFERADYKADELQKVKEEERQVRLKDYWQKFTYAIRSINQPIYDKVKQAESRGEFIPDDQNPKYLLSGRNYLSGRIKADFEEKVAPVMRDLGKIGVDWKTFGEFLLYERITAGDRSEFANPGGITPTDATERINALKTYYGPEKFNTIETNATKFRDFLKGIAEEAYKEGMFSKELFDVMQGNEKYVPFQVVEYMENYVSWKTKGQVGTLKDINNPANSLLLKAIATVRAIENQKMKMATFKLLEDHFSKEIKEAELQFTGRAQRPMESREEGMEMVTYYKDGKLRGKIVDQYIAKGLERDSISRNRAVMTVLSPISYLNQKLFRPLFVIYNPGWIPFNFIRDYLRFWKNTPGLSFIGAAKRYGQAFRAAKIRAFGESKVESQANIEARDLVRKLERERVLSITWNDILSGQSEEDAQIEAVMQKLGLAESKKEIPAIYKPIEKILQKTQIIPILKGIRTVGDLVESLPKIAGYYELEGKMPPEQMREFIRKNIGSPDFFEKGYLTPATNNIFLFSNAIIQAITADTYIATNPTTRSGFWFKTAKMIYVPKILMFAALMGAFGDDLKKLYDDVSEYDMTNYFIIPLGRDSKNGKTAYLRIPMDETSRLLGAVLWKTMRASSNDQSFGRDIGDIASLFGGQLPTLTPSISAPISAFQFAAGQNPYDSFRGRMVLTDEQMAAGGMYALKPFLLWEFQQMGGNIFTKFYLGEQTPVEKSAGEKFLSAPIISNIAGRFVRISDYGQLEKYREKLQEIRGEQAAENIDENKLINEYVGKYQKKEGDFNVLANDLIADVLGHSPRGKEEMTKSKNIRKKFQISIKRGESDPKINALISAVSIEEKVTLLRVYKETMSSGDFEELRKELLLNKIISTNVLRELAKPFQP